MPMYQNIRDENNNQMRQNNLAVYSELIESIMIALKPTVQEMYFKKVSKEKMKKFVLKLREE